MTAARPRIVALVAGLIVVALAAAVFVGVSLARSTPTAPIAATPPSSASASTPPRTPTPLVTPTPTPTGFPADATAYDLAGLPRVDVFAVVPALPVDVDPTGAFTGELVRAAADLVPIFADPTAPPVAALPRDDLYDGTTLPVVEKQEHWVRVLLAGRSAVPSQGNPAQLSGWLRTADVESTTTTETIEVDIAARTLDIVDAGGARERVAADFAWGTDATPTPRGRTFVMLVRAEPSFGYTRGHPLVYLGVQSPTLDGFGGASVAVTAFHYHDQHSGAISNGCIRLDAAAIDRLAQLPTGTPVVIR